MTRELVTEGAWKVRGCGWALGTSSKGTEQVGVDLLILEGPSAGAHITYYGYFTDLTFERTVESLRLLGWTGNDLDDLTGIDRQEAIAVIEHEPDEQGEIRDRVRWINGPGGVAMKDKMDPVAAKSFAARMKGKLLALGAQNGKPAQRPTGAPETQQRMTPAQRAAQSAEAPATDDIPF